MYDHHWYGGGHPLLSWVLAVLLVIAVVLVALLVVRMLLGRGAPATPTEGRGTGEEDDALAIVRMRYARGEIDREELMRLSADLAAAPSQVSEGADDPGA